MKEFYSRLTITLITLLTLQSKLLARDTCSKSCAVCVDIDGPTCTSCWKRLLSDDGTCLENVPVSDEHHCLIWGKGMDCQECIQGYGNMEFFNTDTQEQVEFCFKTNEPNGLFIETFQSGKTPDYTDYKVDRCLNGYPNQNETACESFDEPSLMSLKEEVNGEGNLKYGNHCIWGARDDAGTGMKVCDYCKEGLSVDGRCIPVLKIEGCLNSYSDPNHCTYCDYENGWRMTLPGVCTKEF